MLAADAGKTIQKRYIRPGGRYSTDDWSLASDPGWNFFAYEYRVKPEPPVVKYRLTYSDGSFFEHHDVDDAIKRWKLSPFNPTLQKIVTNE